MLCVHLGDRGDHGTSRGLQEIGQRQIASRSAMRWRVLSQIFRCRSNYSKPLNARKMPEACAALSSERSQHERESPTALPDVIVIRFT
jgi:hypothetical protein